MNYDMPNIKRNGSWFFLCLLLVSMAFSAVYAVGKNANQSGRMGDAAIFEQLIDNIHSGRGVVSNVFASTQNFIDRRYVTKTLEGLLAVDNQPPEEQERNMLQFHAYYVLYLIAPLRSVFSSSLTLILIQTLCIVGVLAGTSAFVARETRSIAAASVFGLLVLANANWSGSLIGQFYPDRIFVFAGFLLFFFAYQGNSKLKIILAALFVALLNERAALIGGGILLATPIYTRKLRGNLSLVGLSCALGLILLSYAYYQKTFVLSNLYYGSYMPANLADLVGRFHLDGFARNALLFLIANGPLLLLALANPTTALIALICMIPNIVGNVGGAEKIGWSTHYHSYYIPALFFAAAVGFTRITNWLQLRSADKRTKRWLRFALPLVFLAIFITYKPYGERVGYLFYGPIEQALRTSSALSRGEPTTLDARARIEALFPQGASVSTTELGMAMLHEKTKLGVFGVDTKNFDYIFYPCSAFRRADSANAVGPTVTTEWLKSQGFDPSQMVKSEDIDYCRITNERKLQDDS
ncbi:MAG: DUF2079 domain-containing protein [Allorhizobium sp.]